MAKKKKDDSALVLFKELDVNHIVIPGLTDCHDYFVTKDIYDVENWHEYMPLKSFRALTSWAAALTQGWKVSVHATSNAKFLAQKTGKPQGGDMGSTRFIDAPRGTPSVFLLGNVRLCYAIKPCLPQEFESRTMDTGEEYLKGSDFGDSLAFDVVVELHPYLHRKDIVNFLMLYIECLKSMAANHSTFHQMATTPKDFMMILKPPVTYNISTSTWELSLKMRAPWFRDAIDYATIKRGKSLVKGTDYAVVDKVFWKPMSPPAEPPESVFYRTIRRAHTVNEVCIDMGTFWHPGNVNVGDTLTLLLNKPSVHQGSNGYSLKMSANSLSFTNDCAASVKSVDLDPEDIATEEDYAALKDGLKALDDAAAKFDVCSTAAGDKRTREYESLVSGVVAGLKEVSKAMRGDETPHEQAVRKGISTQPEDDSPSDRSGLLFVFFLFSFFFCRTCACECSAAVDLDRDLARFFVLVNRARSLKEDEEYVLALNDIEARVHAIKHDFKMSWTDLSETRRKFRECILAFHALSKFDMPEPRTLEWSLE